LYYAITNKRVIIQKGVIGGDFDLVDFDQITDFKVNVNLWDKVLGKNSGSILISSAGSIIVANNETKSTVPFTIKNIDNPYGVFKILKDVSFNVKTDIEYPNQMRPGENPGYQTNYELEKNQNTVFNKK